MQEIQTERLVLRRLNENDAPFINRLLNEPSFLEKIGDRGVRNEIEAVTYLRNGPMAMYDRYGFGLLHVSLRADATPIGMCGILKRDSLEHPDVGYALVPEHWGAGYAGEAARGVIEAAWRDFDLPRLVAITKPDNTGSIRVLEKLGFRFDQMVRATPDGAESRLFVLDSPARVRRATMEDIEALVGLMKEFYAEAGFSLPESAAARTFEALITHPDQGRVYVMRVDGAPAGFGVLTVAFSMEYGGLRGFVDDFFVAPEFRRLGLGGEALQVIERGARAMGVRALLVETSSDNARAVSVYSRFGLRDTGHMLMVKALDAPVHEQG